MCRAQPGIVARGISSPSHSVHSAVRPGGGEGRGEGRGGEGRGGEG